MEKLVAVVVHPESRSEDNEAATDNAVRCRFFSVLRHCYPNCECIHSLPSAVLVPTMQQRVSRRPALTLRSPAFKPSRAGERAGQAEGADRRYRQRMAWRAHKPRCCRYVVVDVAKTGAHSAARGSSLPKVDRQYYLSGNRGCFPRAQSSPEFRTMALM